MKLGAKTKKEKLIAKVAWREEGPQQRCMSMCYSLYAQVNEVKSVDYSEVKSVDYSEYKFVLVNQSQITISSRPTCGSSGFLQPCLSPECVRPPTRRPGSSWTSFAAGPGTVAWNVP